jgi:glutathione peroxidase
MSKAKTTMADALTAITGFIGRLGVSYGTKRMQPLSRPLYSLHATDLDGHDVALSHFANQVTLVVNVASECGFTPQYRGLQALHAELGPRGFAVLGFPSNEFGAQEPGSAADIRTFCDQQYRVTFPLFARIETKAGAGQSPVYALLGESGKLPNWNFCKYLIDRQGQPIAFFPPQVTPESRELRDAIAGALGRV